MGILQIFDRKPKNRNSTAISTRGIGGAIARKTDTGYFGNYFAPIVARSGISTSYKDLSEEILKKLPPDKVRRLIKASNPLVAKALADFANNVSSAFTYTADRTLGDNTIDTPAQRLLDDFLMRMKLKQGGLQGILQELARDMFVHGAAFSELVIDKDGKTPLYIKTLGAHTAVYRRQKDPIRGEYYELGQYIGAIYDTNVGNRQNFLLRDTAGIGSLGWTSFEDEETVQYWPIQKEPNNPYGVPILDPAVFPVIMVAGFMSAFKMALTTQVSPNMIVTIDKQKFSDFAGETVNSAEIEVKLNKLLSDLQEQIKQLGPGDVLLQGDEVQVGGTLADIGRSPLGSLKDIQDVIRRDLIVALQTQPILMGSNETVAETHAIEQMKNYAQVINHTQKALSTNITTYFDLILTLNGYPALSEFKLNYTNAAQYKDQSDTFNKFHMGLMAESDAGLRFVEYLQAAKEAQFIDDATAQLMWNERVEIARQIDILPKEL